MVGHNHTDTSNEAFILSAVCLQREKLLLLSSAWIVALERNPLKLGASASPLRTPNWFIIKAEFSCYV